LILKPLSEWHNMKSFLNMFKKQQTPQFSISGKIDKVDEEQRQVFGWFSVVEESGQPVIDKQGDIITPDDLEKAAYAFVADVRDAGEMHARKGIGHLIESIVFTKAKQQALGIDLGKVGWWAGFQITDEDVWKKVKDGTYRAFSIGGTGTRTPIGGTEE